MFNELSEKAKEKAVESFYDVNVDYEWWESVYEDAKQIGLSIRSFDIDHGTIDGKLELDTAMDTAETIKANHGEPCETYKDAISFIKEWEELVKRLSDGKNTDIVAEGKEDEFDELADNLEQEFVYNLLQDYLHMLRQEYEYLTSKEAIIETIEANEYEFTKDGKQFS